MHKLFRSKSGFTVVEILIVITVVGILAALAVVSYQAYLKNTKNKQTAATAQAYIDALNLYKLEKNDYPAFPEGYACLGEGYDLLSDGSKTCLIQSEWVAQVRESSTLNSALKPYFPGGKLPKVSNVIINIDATHRYSGGYFTSKVGSNDFTLDGVLHPWFVVYFQEGTDTKCPVGPIVTLTDINIPAFSSAVPSSGYTLSISGITFCVVALPAITATT